MYLPWPADKTLTEAFEKNISDMEKAIGKRGLDYEKIVVFISTSSTKATLYEITCKNGKMCIRDSVYTACLAPFVSPDLVKSL